jgi:hypothetical protein
MKIKDKFRANIDSSRIVPKDNVETVLQLLENLESVDNVSKIIELLAAWQKTMKATRIALADC